MRRGCIEEDNTGRKRDQEERKNERGMKTNEGKLFPGNPHRLIIQRTGAQCNIWISFRPITFI
jgi:hypothetical protein